MQIVKTTLLGDHYYRSKWCNYIKSLHPFMLEHSSNAKYSFLTSISDETLNTFISYQSWEKN